MRALTLHQPWATLIAIGAKTIETRSWATAYRGPLAIHAGKSKEWLELCHTEPFTTKLLMAGIRFIGELPLGAIVCTVRLAACIPTNEAQTTELERAFGDHGPNRFAWFLEDLYRFETPIPTRGYRNLWEWEKITGVLKFVDDEISR